ncbi:hypothetical protein Taro_027578 [Colocasia esculenta]|uniref:Uncharacterized protein n=1 Tax=Colocasia esculenta TaxID=4460 RepID=A0A843VP60_COLES|nr:hypothetical protein [Colocasia esculenta]
MADKGKKSSSLVEVAKQRLLYRAGKKSMMYLQKRARWRSMLTLKLSDLLSLYPSNEQRAILQEVRKQINNHIKDTRNLSWFGPSHMDVLRPVPKQPLEILLTKGTVPLMDNTTPITPAGLLLFPGQEGSPLLLQVKKPTSWYKPQWGSARLKPPTRFYTEYSPSAGQNLSL